MLKKKLVLVTGALGLLNIEGTVLAAESADDTATTSSVLTDVITVTGTRAPAAAPDMVQPSGAPVLGPDSTGLVARLPGAAAISNGALSGQVQYRGLFGSRIAVKVDGQAFASGGPNLMDPPLSYAPLALVSEIHVARGTGGVSAGPGLGGLVDARLKKVDFGETDDLRPGYDLMAEGRTVDESYSVGGVAGLADDRVRFHVLGSREEGENREFPGGEIANTFFERDVYGVGGGLRFGTHEISLDLRRSETGPTGNPPFAMDIQWINTDIAQAGYKGTFGDVRLDISLGYADVSHGMDNFTLRPNPALPMMARLNQAGAETVTGGFKLAVPLGDGSLSTGADISRADHAARISNPMMPTFYLDQFASVDQDRTGGFVEWHGDLGAIETEIGIRYDHHRSVADSVELGDAVPMGPRMLQMAFNNADRRLTDDVVDLAARFWWQANDQTTWRATLARKTRVPTYLERFAWLPTEASAGLADGNVYVGDLTLDPEVAWIAEAGVDWVGKTVYARPTLFYRRIDDFIQGVAYDATPGVIDSPVEMVAAMNGDTTPLRFANVDAELYGADLDFGARFGGNWRVDGVASFVRGKRRDIDDNLYRIAPARLTLAGTYEAQSWSISAEGRFVADQNKVSVTNDEQSTSGYAIFSLRGDWQVRDGVGLMLGIENLFDKRYEDHLSGYNRVRDSDVPLGARLPGAGRGAFLRLTVRG